MPSTYTYPGIYVEEIPSGVHPIVGASTSDTAFVDYFPRGPVGVATRVTSLEEFTTIYGGLDQASEASYGIQAYFLNGGQVAWVVRVVPAANPPTAVLNLTGGSPPQNTLQVSAANPGSWGRRVQVAATQTVPAAAGRFNLFVREVVQEDTGTRVVASEVHRNLSMVTTSPFYAPSVVNSSSALVSLDDLDLGQAPTAVPPGPAGDPPDAAWAALSTVADTTVYDSTGAAVPAFAGALTAALPALERIEPFHANILCLPATARLAPADGKTVIDAAAAFAGRRRAMFLVDPPPSTAVASAAAMQAWVGGATGPTGTPNGAVYYPRLRVTDPLDGNRLREIGPSGALAGIYARTDVARGVWKAPAGIDAGVRGAVLVGSVNESDSARLNPLGVNVLRTLPVIGNVVWGARTLFGADQRASEWKYVPVRRTAFHIESSLADGLGWVVFEPNDEPLWAQIRLNVGAFMQDLFRQGAFQGSTPREAYLVKCDRTTTTQGDIDRGVVNILVGFAPLKPAEFVVIRIQQLAGQTQA
jgi:phage tail sheath protein FI